AAREGRKPTTGQANEHGRAGGGANRLRNKKDERENPDPNRVMQQLSEQGLVPEEWGGDTIVVQISALQSLGIDDLLEQLLLVSDVEELVANPEGRARGVVLEANLAVGRGPVATVRVVTGTQ